MAGTRIGIRLEPRDFAFLRELVESRVLTTTHAAALHFGGSPDAAKKRIQRLKAAGFIAERPRKTFEKSVLFLTRRAFQVLQDNGHLADFPKLSLAMLDKRAKVSDLTIRHELAVMEAKVAFSKAVTQRPDLALAQFSTWPRLFSFVSSVSLGGFRMAPSTIKPDGFVRLHQEVDGVTKAHAFFLEVDLSTENLNKLAGKAVAYLHYYSSGGFALWRGKSREDLKKHPFRVLGVFASEKRKENFARRLLENNPPIKHQWYLATFADAVREPLGAIWTTPADYAAAKPNDIAVPVPRPLLISTNQAKGSPVGA
jgi:hypothetical protein